VPNGCSPACGSSPAHAGRDCALSVPETRYTTVDGDRVAYQVLGDRPRDLVFSLGQWGHVDVDWEEPAIARFFRRLAAFSRLIRFDPRGSGLSDPRPGNSREPWQHWIEDLLAVIDVVGSDTAAVAGFRDCGPSRSS